MHNHTANYDFTSSCGHQNVDLSKDSVVDTHNVYTLMDNHNVYTLMNIDIVILICKF